MDEAKDEPWGVRTALRQSLHIIDIHRSKRSAEDPNDSNLPPVPTISQNVPKLEPAHSTPDRVFKANPFDARSGEAVYQVEPLDEHLIDRFPLPPRGQILARRKYFFFAIAGFAFLASIAIGLGIGLSKKQSSTPAQYPGLAVSGLFVKNVTQWNMQLFYQERTSSTINYRISTNTIDYSAAQAITLSHAPTQNTPMAATSFDGTTFHNLFYILNSEIVLANMTCPPSSPTSCSTLTNTVMSKGLQNSVAEDSSIAAVFLGFGVNKGFRIFHHNTTHEVIELALMNGTKQETVITDAAVQGSSLAAVTFSTPGYIQVLYMNAKANTIFTVEYFNGNWLAPTPITALTIPSLPPTTSLTLSYALVPDSFFAYFTSSTSTISEFIARNVSSSIFPAAISSNQTGRTDPGWAKTPDTNDLWTKGMGPGAPVVSTAWADQVRFFQLEGDVELVQSAFNSTSGAWEPVIKL